MKKKIILFMFILIIIGSVVGIKATTTIKSNQVIYKEDKTLESSLDELYEELTYGKEQLATSITNKGVDTTSDNTLVEMADNINNLDISSLATKCTKVSLKSYSSSGSGTTSYAVSESKKHTGYLGQTKYGSTLYATIKDQDDNILLDNISLSTDSSYMLYSFEIPENTTTIKLIISWAGSWSGNSSTSVLIY